MSKLYRFQQGEYARVLSEREMLDAPEYCVLEGIMQEKMREIIHDRARRFGGITSVIVKLHPNYPRDDRVWLDARCSNLCFHDWMITPTLIAP